MNRYIKWLWLLVRQLWFRIRYRGAFRCASWSVGVEPGATLIVSRRGRFIAKGKLYIRKGSDVNVAKSELVFGKNVFLNQNVIVVCRTGIEFGDGCIVGPGCMFFDHDHQFEIGEKPFWQQPFTYEPIKIGKNVWIGAGVIVCKGVTVGDDCVIGAGTVLTKSIPAGSKVYRRAPLEVVSLPRQKMSDAPRTGSSA